MSKKIVVVGAGAAGLIAGAYAAKSGAEVTVVEKNSSPGKKLNITGKGRCNVTNNCDVKELLENIPGNPRFMHSAFAAFTPQDAMAMFESLGVMLKTERGFRVFPESDNAHEITDALVRLLKNNGGKIINDTVCELICENGTVKGVKGKNKTYLCDAVIVATGGVSYPGTGSTGDGYRFAEACGHSIKATTGSLVPLVGETELCRSAQGLSLKNVTLTAKNGNGKVLFSELGEMLFTHFGISGPLVLSASAHMRDFENESYYVEIDLKPGLTHEKLDERLLRDIGERKNADMRNLLRGLLPSGMVGIVLEKSGVDGAVKANGLTKEMRRALRDTLKCLRIDIDEKRPIAEAIVTSGGVNVREINPKTMESKLCKGLFFAGEVLDVDAYTGGFNLQIAWSSGYCAGIYAAAE